MEPKTILIQFLQYWKRGNKKQMFARCTETWQHHHSKNDFEATGLKSFEVGEPKVNQTICDIPVSLNGEPHEVRLVCEAEAGKGDVNGSWGVYPGSFRKVKTKSISLNDAIDRDIPKGTPERDKFDKEVKKELKQTGIKKFSVGGKDIDYSESNVVKMD